MNKKTTPNPFLFLTPLLSLVMFGFITASLTGCSYHSLLPKGPELTATQPIKTGKDSFVINAYKHTDRKTIRVWTFKPTSWKDGDNVLFVMHGVSRNAENYLDTWVEIAKQKNILLVAPEFHNKFYRYTTNDYQDGNLFNYFGATNPEEEWAFKVIDNITDHINQHNPFTINSYDMFGHSAGSQFVHRMVLLYPNNRINTAIAANAGVYTFVDQQGNYPYDLPHRDLNLANAFNTQLIILLGEKDTNTTAGVLDESTYAARQGKHRLERGESFYSVGKKIADEHNYTFSWQLRKVPNVGHNKRLMMEAAADLL